MSNQLANLPLGRLVSFQLWVAELVSCQHSMAATSCPDDSDSVAARRCLLLVVELDLC